MDLKYFSDEDLNAMADRGIGIQEVSKQIELFQQGAKTVRLIKPALMGDGIIQISPDEQNNFISLHNRAARKGRMLKFVPASGAASRMFKDWQSWLFRGKIDPPEKAAIFFKNLFKYPFYADLKTVMVSETNDLETCIREERHADIFKSILTSKGLNYAWLPKALLKFHVYPEHTRTALEEHLAEADLYVRDKKRVCRIHFTVSEEHQSKFQDLISRVKTDYENEFDAEFNIGVTTQHPSTDTIAVDSENRPARDKNGQIIFRPGGHGALLKNLNDLDGDIVYIKNIDNIVPDRLKESTVLHKKILGGYLVQLQDEIFQHLKDLSKKRVSEEQRLQAIRFCQERLFLTLPEDIKKDNLIRILNRPVRVCGMVKNEGEPGGGPFWVEDNGIPSLQIVEQSQIDMASEEQKEIWQSSTHFNPVDLVCGVRDYQGENFDLNDYVDKEAVFISNKSYEGQEIKVLELPGLWNGSMAYWNTIFVEVPISTFNPVKTVEDFLRENHLP